MSDPKQINMPFKVTASRHVTSVAIGQAFRKPPDDHPIYNLIGRVASDWAHLERMLDLIIWDLSGLEPAQGACISAQLMSIWPRIDSIIALLTFHKGRIRSLEAKIRAVRKFGEDCRGPSERRNRVIHDPWYSEMQNEKLIAQHRSMPRSAPTYELKDIDKAEIITLLSDIAALTETARLLRNDIFETLKASQ